MEEKAKLLFVDDEERVVNLLRMMFRGTYEVHTATSGQQALQLVAEHRFDVIVSDQRMPGMLGIELLAKVRERSPVTMRILLTGYSDLSAIVGSVNDGEVFRFVNKPWDNDEIKAIIAEAVQAARASARVMVQMPESRLPEFDGDTAPSVLLIDDNDRDRKAIAEVLGGEFSVDAAASIPQALALLGRRDIGVIVSEASVAGQDASELLRILKQHHPAIATVMLTSSADSDLVIKLINGAQIFRFASKPVRGRVLLLAVTAAMKEHYRFRAQPALLSRYRVAPSSHPEDANMVASVVKSLSGLRARFARFMGRTAS